MAQALQYIKKETADQLSGAGSEQPVETPRYIEPQCAGPNNWSVSTSGFVEGCIWGIDLFDQWSVGLGNKRANKLFAMMNSGKGTGKLKKSAHGPLPHCMVFRCKSVLNGVFTMHCVIYNNSKWPGMFKESA
ncbi:MAG: hypothetical protein HQ483_05990 [Rhodospirillales bacterium]|nr:hypothetical protein [Rhodospirillales bacterium]